MDATHRIEVAAGAAGPVVVKHAAGPDARAALHAEADRLDQAAHPGVVEVLERHPDRLVLAWAGSRTLANARPALPEAAGILASVSGTVADLHRLGIVHGRIDATHVVLDDDDGRPRLCGFRAPGADQPTPTPADDVAALGALIDALVGPDVELEPIPERRWRAQRWTGYQRRALQGVADQAVHEDLDRRPSARALAAAIADAVPGAAVGRPAPAATAVPAATADPPGRSRRRSSTAARIGLVVVVVALGGGLAVRERAASPARWEPARAASPRPTDPREQGDRPEVPEPEPRLQVDVDGDGSVDRVVVGDTTIEAGGATYAVGRPGDRVSVADWDCDGTATPGLVRPGTGEVFLFDGWAEPGAAVTVAPTAVLDGARSLVAPRSGETCDPHVRLEDRTTRSVSEPGGGR